MLWKPGGSPPGILAMRSPADLPTKSVEMTIAELGQQFQHRELARDGNWRSYSTRRNYEFNLRSGSFRDGETMNSVRCERSKSNPGCEACH